MMAEAEASTARSSRLHRLIVPLAVIGVVISGYLTYVKLSGGAAFCAGVGNCDLVQSSRYSELFGIPVALLGMLTYIALLALWGWGQNPDAPLAEIVPLAFFGLALVGVLYSAYLTYVEVFILRAICPWCVASAVDMTLIFLLAFIWVLDSEVLSG